MSTLPVGAEIVITRHGPMAVFKADPWVSRSLRELGEYSEHELEFLTDIIRRRAYELKRPVVMVEAGAFIGDMTIPLARLCKHVYAFEPNPGNRELLIYNLILNHIQNVTVFPYGVGAVVQDGLGMSRSEEASPGSYWISGSGDVQITTLDTVITGPIDLIKGDVEGMEVPMLAGSIRILTENKPWLFMEADTVLTPGMINVDEAMQSMGYAVSKWAFLMYRPENWRGCADNIFGATASFMSLGVPPDAI